MAEILQPPIILEIEEAAARAAEAQPVRNYLGMSEIGKICSRALWMSFRGYIPHVIEGRPAMIFEMGNHVEDMLIQYLEATKIFKITERQREFSAIDGFFRGHWDGCIEGVTQKPHVLEIKSASDLRFKAFQTEGVMKIAPEYYAQVQCYMGYSGLERAIFLIMNKNSCSLYSERVHFNRSVFERLEARAKRIIFSFSPPMRAKDISLCKTCRFLPICNNPDYKLQPIKTCGTCACCMTRDETLYCTHFGHQIVEWGVVDCEAWEFISPIADRVPF